ncbi:MAG: DUF5004 domain-containing protein [Methylococcales bacterium]
MFKFATLLFYVVIYALPALSYGALQGKWNVTELVTIKTSWDKDVRVQSQKNQTTFNFNADRSFVRSQQDILLSAGTYKESAKTRTFKVAIKNSSYNQVGNVNSIKARIQANLAVRGYKVLRFSVKTNKFNGKVFNESLSPSEPLSDDVHLIHGAYSYTITMRIAKNFADRKRYKMVVKVDSTYSGARDATDAGALDWAIENKKQLWPLL